MPCSRISSLSMKIHYNPKQKHGRKRLEKEERDSPRKSSFALPRMVIKTFLPLGLAILLPALGCTSADVNTSSPSILTATLVPRNKTPGPIVTPSPIVNNTSIPISTGHISDPTPLANLFEPNIPEVIQLCPTQPEVEYGSLGFEAEFKLVVNFASTPNSGIWILDSTGIDPQMIPNTNPGNGVILYEDSSPSGTRIVFSSYASNIDSGEKLIEVIRADGSERRPIKTVASGVDARWLTEDIIILFGPAYQDGPYVPLSIIDPGTSEETIFGYIPDEVYLLETLVSEEYSFGIFFNDFFKISSNKYEPRLLGVDLFSQEETPILPWLENQPWFTSDPGLIYQNLNIFALSDGQINIVVERPYGLDLLVGARYEDLTTITDYEKIMMPIKLPDVGPNIRITWTSNIQPMFVFDRLDITEYEPRKSSFYVYNADDQLLMDYCLDRGHVGRTAIASHDERYLAWTEYALEGGYRDPEASVILDLAAGKFIRVPDMEVLGWVKSGN